MLTTPKRTLIAPSLLSADFSNLGSELSMVEKAGADVIHLDVMDGCFVPNISIGIPVVASLRNKSSLPFDCHLMIINPEKYVGEFIKAGANWVSIHHEASENPSRVLATIRQAGAKAGIVLKPQTPVEVLENYVDDFDFVLLMSVNPGFGGQKFMPEVLDRIRTLVSIRQRAKKHFLIEVDGGINLENAKALIRAGADVLVAGHSIFRSANPAEAIKEFKSIEYLAS
ncbi:MAG: ribulose-phosphate 3-epimerase [Holophagaceae bacterium]